MSGRPPGRDAPGGFRVRARAFKVLAPEPLVGGLLGGARGGGPTQKEEIQNETGAKLTLSNRDEHYPHSRLRLIIVHADETSQVLSALGRLVDKVVDCSTMEREGSRGGENEFLGQAPGEITFRVALPSVIDERVIGENGDGLVQLAEDTGAHVSADHEFYDGHFMVQLSGVPKVVRRCLEQLVAEVDAVSGEEPFAVWAAVRAFPPPGGSDVDHRQHNDAANSRDTRRHDHRDGSGHRHGDRHDDRPPPRSRSAHADPQGRGSGHGDPHGLDSYHRSSHGRHERGREAIGSMSSGKAVASAQPPQQHPMLEALGVVSELFADGVDRDYLITCELPARRCGALIGKKGEYVEYVQRISGCKVQFEAEDRGASEDSTRKMTITGRLFGVYLAHALMMKRFLDTEGDARLRPEEDPLRQRLEAMQLSSSSSSGGSRAPAPGAGAPPAVTAYDVDCLRRLRRSAMEANYISDGRQLDSDSRRRTSSHHRPRDDEPSSHRRSEPRRSRSRRRSSQREPPGNHSRISDEAAVSAPRSKAPAPASGPPSKAASRAGERYSNGQSYGVVPPPMAGSQPRRLPPEQSDCKGGGLRPMLPPGMAGAAALGPVGGGVAIPPPMLAPKLQSSQFPEMRTEDATTSGFLRYVLGASSTLLVSEEGGLRTMGRTIPQPVATWEDAISRGYVSAALRSGLQANSMFSPTSVQRHMLPLIASEQLDAIIEAPAGSGKTFGYLLPLVSRLAMRLAGPRAYSAGPVVVPSILLLVPSKEVATAHAQMARDLAMVANQELTVLLLTSTGDLDAYTMVPERRPVDIVIGIAEVIRHGFDAKRLSFSQVQTVVLDDADGLLEMPLANAVDQVLRFSDIPQKGRQTILVARFFWEELGPPASSLVRGLPDVVAFQAALDATVSMRPDSSSGLAPAVAAPGPAAPAAAGAAALVEHRVGWVSNEAELWRNVGDSVVALLQACNANASYRRMAVFTNSIEQARSLVGFLQQRPEGLRCLEWPSHPEVQLAAVQEMFNHPVEVLAVAHGIGMPFNLQALQQAGVGAILQMELPNNIEAYHTRVSCMCAGGISLSYATDRDAALLPALRQAMIDAGSCAPSWMSSSDGW
mmetsp:Transcript_17705/g.41140  ORF Transcript_17705/g.41140 Transcript_17705/m.41140 type:complete len:1104 (+) Transcript_17705:67-3378(+)